MKDIKPKYLKNRKRWQVDFNTKIPQVKDPDGNGEMVGRRTSHFKTEEEALDWLARVRKAQTNTDLDMCSADRIEYRTAKDKLIEKGFDDTSLVDVVTDWLKYRSRIISDKTVFECYQLWIEAYEKKAKDTTRSGSTTDDLKRIRPALEPFFDNNIGDFEQPQVAEELAKHIRTHWKDNKPVTLRNTFTKAVQFLHWCKRKDIKLLPAETPNPLEDLSEVEVPLGDPPYIVSVEEAREIMHTAHLTDSRCHLLPYMILHCLCGLRPSEVVGMKWEHIHLEDQNEPFVYVPLRATGKNKRARKVMLKEFPAVVEWFKVCDWSKPLFPYKRNENGKMDRNFYDKRRIVLDEAVVLTQDAKKDSSNKYDDFGRHSCATYLYAAGYNQKTITERIGNSSKVLMKHYLNSESATESQAKEYFSIMPIKSEDKLVNFSG